MTTIHTLHEHIGTRFDHLYFLIGPKFMDLVISRHAHEETCVLGVAEAGA